MEMDIRAPGQISVDWINRLLELNGHEGTVDTFEVSPIGSGLLAESRRFSLHYADGQSRQGRPQSIVGKFPAADAGNRSTCRTYNLYRSEVLFYKELAERSGILVPSVLAAEFDAATHDFILLCEDMAPCRAGDQLRGMSVEEGHQALREVARLHASFWNDATVFAKPWIAKPQTAQGFYTTELFEQAWDAFRKVFQGRIEPEVEEVCARFVNVHPRWNVALDTPKCLTHSDFRADNMLIDDVGGRVVTVDWQTVNVLGAGMDAAYFVGGSIDTQDRRDHEQRLLDTYYGELVDRGVRGYSFDQFYRDYRHYSLAGLTVAIAVIVLAKRSPRGDEMALTMVNRHARHVMDVDALQLLC